MFSETDKDYVTEALVKQVAAVGDPRGTLTGPFFGTTFPEHLCQGMPRELAIDAIRLCTLDGWAHDPLWMQKLLDIFQLRVIDGKIYQIWERSRHRPPEAANPFDAIILNNSTPFVNRRSLRTQLTRLATPAANVQPILVVNGQTRSGKSYSTNYIDHFSNKMQGPAITNYRLVFRPEFGLEMGAEQVARDLVFKMGRSILSIPPKETNLKLYVQQLAVWVLNEAAQSPSQQWFVLDDFRGDQLRPDTRDFLVALSDLVTTGVFAQRCRLILIGFDRAMLTVEPGKIEEEKIRPCNRADLDAAILEILDRAPLPLKLETFCPFILDAIPEGAEKMEELNWRLRALLYAINELTILLADIPDIDFVKVLTEMLDQLPQGKARLTELESRLLRLEESKKEI